MNATLRLLQRLSPAAILLGGSAAIVLIGAADALTGYEFDFFIFHLLPVCTAAFFAGRRPGLVLSGLSAAVWLYFDINSGHPYSNSIFPFWTAAMLFGFYSCVTFVLAAYRRSQEQLMQEKLNLEKANAELNSFAQVVSHDLRAPLRGIAGFAELLELRNRGKLDAEGIDYLGQIRNCAKKMDSLIKDILHLSKVQKTKTAYEDVEVGPVVRNVLDMLSMNIQLAQASVVVDNNLPTLRGEKAKIEQIFLNLINNALKFSSKKDTPEPPKIRVGYQSVAGVHEFHIKDNGIGIAPDFKGQLFQMFRRYHSQEEYEGTGTGLYLVKTIVESHGGKIWVNSKEGKGTTFYFTLPKPASK